MSCILKHFRSVFNSATIFNHVIQSHMSVCMALSKFEV